MAPADWDSGFGRSIGMFLDGGIETVDFILPGDEYASRRVVEIHTGGLAADEFAACENVPVTARSVLVPRAPKRY